ncbi:MAG TPA: sugar kinase [Pseudonocardiaceae bacterium]|jgi:2-dehydro-3-deoxygluconokinase|nr:sugar kinase [Pseudonocardiaceae bacterium]
MTGTPDVVTIGETMVMLVPPDSVPLAEAATLAVHIGGAESNVAVYLVELGHRARWVSRLGDDPFGDLVLRQLAESGVDTSAVARVPGGRTGLYLKDPGAGRTTVHYYREQSPAAELTPATLDDPLVAGGRVLHLSGITAALSRSACDLVRTAVRERPDPDRLVSFDVNYRPKLWPVDEAAVVLAEIADAADLVFVGFDEAQKLWDCTTPADVRDLLPKPATVVVKDGAIGAHSFGTDEVFVPTPRVTVVEPVGAGDAFAAGYLAGVLEDEDDRARLRLGHLVAAAALSVRSDHAHLPSRARLRECVALSEEDWSRLDLSVERPGWDGRP